MYQLTFVRNQDTLYQCRVAQENGARANVVSILTGTTKLRFSCIYSSVMYYPNFTYFTLEVPSTQGRLHFKYEENLPMRMSKQTLKKKFFIFSS